MADPDPSSEAERLDALRRKVAEAQAKRAPKKEEAPQSAASLALRIGGEFGAAILVGAGIGYGADFLLKTQPWGLVIGLCLGFAAAVVSVVRAANAYNAQNPVDPNAPRAPDEPDER